MGIKMRRILLVISVFCVGFVQVERKVPWERTPANFIPEEGFEPPPPRKRHWAANIFVEDDAGVMKSIKSNMRRWDEMEEYSRLWNIYSIGLYKTPGREGKKRYLSKKLLKYIDKRLSGEIKNAEEGSTLKSIQKAHDVLKPNTKAQLTENIKIRLKARLLQGEARFFVENPYVDFQTHFRLGGETNLNIGRTISSLNVRASVDYMIDEGHWRACIERPLGKSLKARISSGQSDEDMIFTDQSEQKAELIFQKEF